MNLSITFSLKKNGKRSEAPTGTSILKSKTNIQL